MMHLPVVTAIGQYFDRRRPLVMGIVTCGTGIGVFAVVPFAEFLKNLVDWRSAHFAFGK